MPQSTAHLSTAMNIESHWIDYNGHFNMAYYGVLFDRAADQMFAALGLGPDYVKTTNNSFFTLETHCSYLREVQATDVVTIASQIIDHDHKRVHYVQQMRLPDANVACILEVMVSHVNLNTHKTSNFPDDVKARIDEMAAEHKSQQVPTQVGHTIGMPRKP
jgi:acyl-CoA thioester hydrolase